MGQLKLRLAAFALILLAACSPPARPDAAPPVATVAAPIPPPVRPAVRIPADAPPEPAPRPRVPLVIDTAAGPRTIQVEMAVDDAERSQGLMFRRSMAPDHGMLFDFQAEKPVFFWMRNTYIPLDMVFIKSDGTIAAIASNTTPLSEAPVGPGVPVQAVLELNAGRAEELGVHPGDRVRHAIFNGG